MQYKQKYLHELIRTIIEDYFTKNKEPIEFKVTPNSESDRKSAWVVDKIEAFIHGEPVGYLNISYIPKDSFEKNYPTLFDYLIQKGMVHLSKFDINDPEQHKQALLAASGYGDWNKPTQADLEDPKFFKRLEKWLKKKYGQDYKDFKEFHVDKPLVDYIRVHEPFQRKGIAVALYNYGAKYLAKKGLKLYASGLQSDAAKAAWDYLRKTQGATLGTEPGPNGKTRTFLSYL